MTICIMHIGRIGGSGHPNMPIYGHIGQIGGSGQPHSLESLPMRAEFEVNRSHMNMCIAVGSVTLDNRISKYSMGIWGLYMVMSES